MRLARAPRRLLRIGRDAATRARWAGLDALARAQRSTPTPAVALTFDDGPQPGTTDRVLDLLAAHDVTATFFCVGRNAVAHPGLLARIRAEGHTIGSHSFSHPDPQQTPLRALALDYRRGAEAVSEALGEPVTLFRPPRGFLDPVRAWQLRRLGMPPRLWSIDPRDWHPDTRAAAIADDVGRAGPGAVVLLHDWIENPWHTSVLSRSETLAALPELINRIRSRGLSFTTLD